MTTSNHYQWDSTYTSPGFMAQEVEYVHAPLPPSSIVLQGNGMDEMIKITQEGFWVRGKKVAQDDKEAEVVYNAFKQWLAWANLQR